MALPSAISRQVDQDCVKIGSWANHMEQSSWPHSPLTFAFVPALASLHDELWPADQINPLLPQGNFVHV